MVYTQLYRLENKLLRLHLCYGKEMFLSSDKHVLAIQLENPNEDRAH